MKSVVVARVLAVLIVWIPATYLLHVFFLHDLDEKLSMSGDELHAHYQRIAGLLSSPLNAAFLAILNLVFLIAIYEVIAAGILALLRRSEPKS